MSLSVEEMNKQLPVANALPGEAVPYYMASGEGARYEINGQLVHGPAIVSATGGRPGSPFKETHSFASCSRDRSCRQSAIGTSRPLETFLTYGKSRC